MKIYIEGYETKALQGAIKLLQTNAPCRIWFEYQRLAVLESGSSEFTIFELFIKCFLHLDLRRVDIGSI